MCANDTFIITNLYLMHGRAVLSYYDSLILGGQLGIPLDLTLHVGI